MKRIFGAVGLREDGKNRQQLREAFITILILTATTAVAAAFYMLGFSNANLIMVYIFGVVLVSVGTRRLFGILASVLSVVLFNFFFTEPRYTFAVYDSEYILTFVVMLAVALVTSALTVREKIQAHRAAERERRANILFRMSRALLTVSGRDVICRTALVEVREAVHGTAFIVLLDAGGCFTVLITREETISVDVTLSEQVNATLRSAIERQETVGLESAPGSRGLYIPLSGAEGNHGILCHTTDSADEPLTEEETALLQTFAAQVSLALDREKILSRHEEAKVRAENEKLRATILRSISHDLRTPLAGITGSSSTLLSNSNQLDERTKRELARKYLRRSDMALGSR